MRDVRIVQPEGWPRPAGYANGVSAAGRLVFVAGQIGWNPATGAIEAVEFAEQARIALENVLAVVRAAGGTSGDVTRLTWFVTDLAAYAAARKPLGQTFRSLFAGHYPAMSVVQVSGLLEPGAQVEIEATAVLP